MVKPLGTFYSAPSAKLLDKNYNIVGECLDTPNTIAYCMAKDERILKVKSILGTFPREEYSNRFWFAVKDFTPETAYWTKY